MTRPFQLVHSSSMLLIRTKTMRTVILFSSGIQMHQNYQLAHVNWQNQVAELNHRCFKVLSGHADWICMRVVPLDDRRATTTKKQFHCVRHRL
jgi:hypothetical protein